MSKLKFLSSIVLSVSLFCAAPSQAISVQSPEFVSDVIHRTYPLVAFVVSKSFYSAMLRGNPIEKLSEIVSIAATRHTGQQLARAVAESGVVTMSSHAQGVSAFGLLGVFVLVSPNYYLFMPLEVGIVDRLGHAFRDTVNENAARIKGLVSEDKAGYAVPAVKAAVPVVLLSTIARLGPQSPGMNMLLNQGAWVSSELIGEAVYDHLKNGIVESPTIARAYTGGILAGVGLIGIVLTADTFAGVASDMLLRTGVTNGLEIYVGPNDGKLKGKSEMGMQAAAAVAGAILHYVNYHHVRATSTTQTRILKQVSIGLFLPLAFSAVDWTKEIIGHLYWQN